MYEDKKEGSTPCVRAGAAPLRGNVVEHGRVAVVRAADVAPLRAPAGHARPEHAVREVLLHRVTVSQQDAEVRQNILRVAGCNTSAGQFALHNGSHASHAAGADAHAHAAGRVDGVAHVGDFASFAGARVPLEVES